MLHRFLAVVTALAIASALVGVTAVGTAFAGETDGGEVSCKGEDGTCPPAPEQPPVTQPVPAPPAPPQTTPTPAPPQADQGNQGGTNNGGGGNSGSGQSGNGGQNGGGHNGSISVQGQSKPVSHPAAVTTPVATTVPVSDTGVSPVGGIQAGGGGTATSDSGTGPLVPATILAALGVAGILVMRRTTAE